MIQERDSARKYFLEVWARYKHQTSAEPPPPESLESLVLDVILQHPEYHGILEQDEEAIAAMEFPSAAGVSNPFLHMGMHIAILEQVGSNRPAGITALYRRLLRVYPGVDDLQHRMMERLGETLYLAQRNNSLPDEAQYLRQVERLLKTRSPIPVWYS